MDSSSRKFTKLLLAVAGMLTVVPCDVQSSEDNDIDPSEEQRRHGALGQGFFIPKEDLLSSELTARGATIFYSLPENCIISNNVRVDRKDESFYTTTTALYRAITTDTNIDISLKGAFTMGASVQAVTNNLVRKDERITGNSLELYAQSWDYSISQNCINEQQLTENFLNDFKRLNTEITSPWLTRSWERYRVFYKKYGSHVVTTVLSGASIYQYAFSKSDKNYSERNFTVKACASLAGPTNVGKLGVSACSGVTRAEMNSASKLSMFDKSVIRGGKGETRAKLINTRDQDTIREFLQEAKSNPAPIMHKFISVWDILQQRYIGTPLMAQAHNLEQYYKGFLNYGCRFRKTSNGEVMQKFVPTPDSTPEFPSYQCSLGPSGCHRNSDCHYKTAFWCACAGESCIRYKDVSLTSGFMKTVAYAYKSRSSGWGWQGCKLSGFRCKCKAPRSTWEVTWRDEQETIRRDFHSSVKKQRIRDEATIRALEERCSSGDVKQ